MQIVGCYAERVGMLLAGACPDGASHIYDASEIVSDFGSTTRTT